MCLGVDCFPDKGDQKLDGFADNPRSLATASVSHRHTILFRVSDGSHQTAGAILFTCFMADQLSRLMTRTWVSFPNTNPLMERSTVGLPSDLQILASDLRERRHLQIARVRWNKPLHLVHSSRSFHTAPSAPNITASGPTKSSQCSGWKVWDQRRAVSVLPHRPAS